jgi:hypothetical protein
MATLFWAVALWLVATERRQCARAPTDDAERRREKPHAPPLRRAPWTGMLRCRYPILAVVNRSLPSRTEAHQGARRGRDGGEEDAGRA